MLRRHIQGLIRRRAEARSFSSHSASLQARACSGLRSSHQGRGCTSGSVLLARGRWFQGHTSWQMSQPATQGPRAAAIPGGSAGSRFSIVWKARQRRASTTKGSGMAPVGQASRQALQAPQWGVAGASAGSSRLVSRWPSSSQEPRSRWIRLPCLPIQPRPASSAQALSSRGALSTQARQRTPGTWASSQRPSWRRRPSITRW